MIQKVGKKFVVKTKDGSRVLGVHDSKVQAQDQLAAIEMSKRRKGK